MSKLVLIIDQPRFTWIPPRFGDVTLIVEQYATIERDIIHLCCDACDRFTYVGNKTIPAVYSMIRGGVKNIFSEVISLQINGPVEFYFTNEENDILNVDTPVVRVVVNF